MTQPSRRSRLHQLHYHPHLTPSTGAACPSPGMGATGLPHSHLYSGSPGVGPGLETPAQPVPQGVVPSRAQLHGQSRSIPASLSMARSWQPPRQLPGTQPPSTPARRVHRRGLPCRSPHRCPAALPTAPGLSPVPTHQLPLPTAVKRRAAAGQAAGPSAPAPVTA